MKNYKKYKLLFMALVFVLSFSACKGEGDPDSFTPDHYGAYLLDGESVQEMIHSADPVRSSDPDSIPSTNSSQPTIIIWHPDVVLSNLYFVGEAGNGKPVEFNASPTKDDALRIQLKNPLDPDVYCFMQSDFYGVPVFVLHWCFQVSVSASSDNGESQCSVMDVENIKYLEEIKITEEKKILFFSFTKTTGIRGGPAGWDLQNQLLKTCGIGKNNNWNILRIYDLSSFTLSETIKLDVSCLDISPDGKFLLGVSETEDEYTYNYIVLDLTTLNEVVNITKTDADPLHLLSGEFLSNNFISVGEYYIWDIVNNGKLANDVNPISPDGHFQVVYTRGEAIPGSKWEAESDILRLRDLLNGIYSYKFQLSEEGINFSKDPTVEFSQDGNIVYIYGSTTDFWGKEPKLYFSAHDISTGRIISSFERPGEWDTGLIPLSLLPDGSILFGLGPDFGNEEALARHIIDTTTGKTIHYFDLGGLNFSPDGRYIKLSGNLFCVKK